MYLHVHIFNVITVINNYYLYSALLQHSLKFQVNGPMPVKQISQTREFQFPYHKNSKLNQTNYIVSPFPNTYTIQILSHLFILHQLNIQPLSVIKKNSKSFPSLQARLPETGYQCPYQIFVFGASYIFPKTMLEHIPSSTRLVGFISYFKPPYKRVPSYVLILNISSSLLLINPTS